MRLPFALISLLSLVVAASPARADDPDFLDFQAGTFDIRHAHTAAFDLEYRSSYKLIWFKPMVGILTTSRGALYGYGGFALDLYFGRRWVVTGSEAIGGYRRGNDVNLGATPEFRSAIDFAYRFDDRSRLGLMFHHISNAGIGKQNPGSETLLLNYAYPLDKLRRQLGIGN